MSKLTPPVFQDGCVYTNDLNAAFSSIVAEVNRICSKVDGLSAAQPDLSGYVTKAIFDSHLGAACPHPKMMIFEGVPAGKCALIKHGKVTIGAGGTATIAFAPPFPTAVGPDPIVSDGTISALTTGGGTVTGTPGQVITWWVAGW